MYFRNVYTKYNKILLQKCERVISQYFAVNRRLCGTYDQLLSHARVKKYLKSFLSQDTHFWEQYPEVNKLVEEIADVQKEKDSLRHLENDSEMKKLVEEEISMLNLKLKSAYKQILICLTPETTGNQVIMEITAGVGGKEAMLFANDLWTMYENYALYRGWHWSPEQFDKDDLGGLRRGAARISGPLVVSLLPLEAGVHRVQRIPSTEKAGRIHTSTATVAVLDIPDSIEITINPEDLRIETKTSSGAGGQHVNKTESCVRITHLPTGIVVENQTDRSQIRNRKIAIERLKEKLYHMERQAIYRSSMASRKSQVGDSERSEKIRTYNYPQDRVTDHRLGVTLHNIPNFLEGGSNLDRLIHQLVDWRIQKVIVQLIDSRLDALNRS